MPTFVMTDRYYAQDAGLSFGPWRAGDVVALTDEQAGRIRRDTGREDILRDATDKDLKALGPGVAPLAPTPMGAGHNPFPHRGHGPGNSDDGAMHTGNSGFLAG